MQRRQFLQHSLVSAGALAASTSLARAERGRDDIAPDPLRLLLLGGTGFIGPHIIAAARARGHHVTLFNRGRTNPHLFPDLEKRRGNRDPDRGEGLRALTEGTWDVVIDTSGFVPRIVQASAELLADRVRHYVFISSTAVYADVSTPGAAETSELAPLLDPRTEVVDGQTYGGLKALCEAAARSAFSGRATSIRPGYIVGPRDPYHRLTYWAMRIARGGEMLAPGTPTDPVQYIDARDLARFVILESERRTGGAYNLVGPRGAFTMAQLLYGCQAAFDTDVAFTWITPEVLESFEISLPLWVPPNGPFAGYGAMSNARACRAGASFRPLAETVLDTYRWYETLERPQRERVHAILSTEVESRVLAARGVAPS